jgi:hypothetical protein
MLRIPHCLDNRLTDGSKVVNPTHPPHSTLQKHYFSVSGTHFCLRLSEPQCLVRPKGLGKFKNSHHRESNPRPPGLQHSALTTTLPSVPRDQYCSNIKFTRVVVSLHGPQHKKFQTNKQIIVTELAFIYLFCRGPLSLVSTSEELLGRESSGSGLESREYGRKGSASLTTRHPSIGKSWH